MSQPEIKAIAFDLDGLMFNTEDLYVEVARRMLHQRGFELEMPLIHRMMGRPARVAFPIMIEWYGLTDTVSQLEDETQQIFHQLLPSALKPMPGLLPLLSALDRAGLPKAIATSSGRSYLERVLELAALPTTFEFSLTADDVTNGKPDPEVYFLTAARFGVEPAEMAVLEDSENGCRAAISAGTKAIAVPGAHNVGSDYTGAALIASALSDPRVAALLGVEASDV